MAAHLAAADVFVFPSLTDTFGVVQLEAAASGVPIAAFPVTGPKDVVGNNPIGVLNEDLRVACLEALRIPRAACRAFALGRSWENSALQFIGHVQKVASGRLSQAAHGHGGGNRHRAWLTDARLDAETGAKQEERS